MRCYRIAKAAYARDLTGEGSRLYGGRWTPKGYPVLYTSEHPALAAWELVVQFALPVAAAPLDHRLVTLEVPDTASAAMETVPSMPHDPCSTGLDWLERGETLLLRVPSVVIPHSWNILINPGHPDMAGVTIVECSVFAFDSRVRDSVSGTTG